MSESSEQTSLVYDVEHLVKINPGQSQPDFSSWPIQRNSPAENRKQGGNL